MSLSKPPSITKEAQRANVFETGGMADSSVNFRTINSSALKTPQTTLVNECPINNEIANIFGQSELFLGVCPSTWHFSSERHSPVIPSSHSVHKLSYKDKQLQLMEKQRDLCHPHSSFLANTDSNPWNYINNQCVLERRVHRQQNVHMQNSEPRFQHSLVQGYDPAGHYRDNCCTAWCATRQCNNYLRSDQGQGYSYPPSPPLSPRSASQQCWNVCTPPESPFNMCGCNQIEYTPYSQGNMPGTCLPGYYGYQRKCQGRIQSHASIKVSMIYNSNINYYPVYPNYAFGMSQSSPQDHETNRYGCYGNSVPQYHQMKDAGYLTNHIKPDPGNSQSCAVMPDFVTNSTDCKQYDIEASIHMRIVESNEKAEKSMAEVNLPASDSFMDYLNS